MTRQKILAMDLQCLKQQTHSFYAVGVLQGEGSSESRRQKQGVLTENLWPKLFSEAPRCAPLRLLFTKQMACRPATDSK
jgi:hypothetical protein